MPVARALFDVGFSADARSRVDAGFEEAKLELSEWLPTVDLAQSRTLGQVKNHFVKFLVKVFDAHAKEIVRESANRQRRERYLNKVIEWLIEQTLPPQFSAEEDDTLEHVSHAPVDGFLPHKGWWEKMLAESFRIRGAADAPGWLWGLRISSFRERVVLQFTTKLNQRVGYWLTRSQDGTGEISTAPRLTPAEVIGAWLQQNGVTKQSLAGRAGISRNTLARIINNQPVRADSLSKVAEVIGCDFRELLPRT